MSWLDKLMGRVKRAAGEALDKPTLREEGRQQEEAARAQERAEDYEEKPTEERERALERKQNKSGRRTAERASAQKLYTLASRPRFGRR